MRKTLVWQDIDYREIETQRKRQSRKALSLFLFQFGVFTTNSYICPNKTRANMTAAFYLALEKRLLEFFPNDNIDLYTGQERDLSANPLYATENWLIEFLPIVWLNGGNETQRGELDFIIHHMTHTGYADRNRITQLNAGHFHKHADLMKALHKFSCTFQYVNINLSDTLLNQLSRVTSEMDNNLSNLIISRHRFRCQIWDYSANKVYQQIMADLHLQLWLAQNLSDNDRTDSITSIGNGD
jgi:hypothetical protein